MAVEDVVGAYHVLVAVGEHGRLEPLLAVGCALAAARNGRVTLLTVTPSGQRPAWLSAGPEIGSSQETGAEETHGVAELVPPVLEALPPLCTDVPIELSVRAGKDVGVEILAAAREIGADLILLGWRGGRSRGRYLLGRTL